ncbi:MAG: GAF domain-containing sensor histidine kinase, partial [Chloroflexota bacterium]
YGLAFFIMGVALALASRQTSEFRFALAIRPLAAFGILHGLHEWFEMFQKIATLTRGYAPSAGEEAVRLALLSLSFVMLLAFGISLLSPHPATRWRQYIAIGGMGGLWLAGLGLVTVVFKPPPAGAVALADVLARYSLGVPGALLGTWALMAQQRTFREHDMPQFGQDLVWCAAALFLYGVVGQIFVRETILFPSAIINSTLFLQWFGIPVQLFRAVMAAVLTFYMVRALKAFELENQRRLAWANQARLLAQAAALEAERQISHEMEQLNEELRLTTRELSLLLDLSNVLAMPTALPNRLHDVLQKIVESLSFPEAGLILLSGREPGDSLQVIGSSGFSAAGSSTASRYSLARALGERCLVERLALCRHLDGAVIEVPLEEALQKQQCRHYQSPTLMISLPLAARQQVIGSLVLVQPETAERPLVFDELKLMIAIAQQLGLFIENARLYQEAQKREKLLAELLHQVVGAQEAERRRIARELHDATGQSLTAITLGLRGVENVLLGNSPAMAQQINELRSYGTQALGELRQIIADLRPSQLDDLGLVAALQWYAQEFQKRYTLPVDLKIEGEPARLLSEYETVLFRITQEALTNIAKHAHATQVKIRLQTSSAQISISIKDDGCGFDPQRVLREHAEPGGWGLLGIAERTMLLGGRYQIDSAPGQGT